MINWAFSPWKHGIEISTDPLPDKQAEQLESLGKTAAKNLTGHTVVHNYTAMDGKSAMRCLWTLFLFINLQMVKQRLQNEDVSRTCMFFRSPGPSTGRKLQHELTSVFVSRAFPPSTPCLCVHTAWQKQLKQWHKLTGVLSTVGKIIYSCTRKVSTEEASNLEPLQPNGEFSTLLNQDYRDGGWGWGV